MGRGSKIVFRFQPEIVPEDFILAAWRTESRPHAGMQRYVCLLDLVTARKPIRPDAAELVEVIEAPAGDEDQIFNRRYGRLQESSDLLSVIADERWLRSKNLQDKRALLPCVETAIEES